MDLQWIHSIPPVTRYWSFSVLLSAMLVSTNMVKKMSLVFLPDSTFAGQYWRLVTSFCFFSPMSIELLLSILIRVRSIRYLEESHVTKLSCFPDSVEDLSDYQKHILKDYIDRYRSLDYLYFVLQICCSLLTWVTIYYYKYDIRFLTLGDMLDDILLYIWCRKNPNMEVNILGLINIPTVYMPWISMSLNWMLSISFLPAFVSLMEMRFSLFFIAIYKSPFFWRMLISYLLSHIWWFISSALIDEVYYETNETRRKLRRETFQKYNKRKTNFVASSIKILLLPPWYWVILHKVQKLQEIPEQTPEERSEQDLHRAIE